MYQKDGIRVGKTRLSRGGRCRGEGGEGGRCPIAATPQSARSRGLRGGRPQQPPSSSLSIERRLSFTADYTTHVSFKRHATPAATAPYRPSATQHARGDWPRVWFTRVFPLSASSAWCPVAGKAAVRPRRSPTSSTNGVEFAKVRRYNWHSAGSLGWPFPVLKYKYIFQINYTEAISSNSTWKLLWFEITKMLIAV